MRRASALLVLVAGLPWRGEAQATPKAHVLYVAEQATLPAGKLGIVELHFKVDEGFHVNSHKPTSEFLIPTTLEAKPPTGITAGAPSYSAGQSYSFPFSREVKLDVYTGDFFIKLPVTAAAGAHTVDATLHYQACDRAACYPPRSLPLQILLTAK